MLAKSNIQKGRRFENYIAKEITLAGLGKATREIGSGSGTRKGDIACNLPFLLEVKNQKTVNFLASLDQSVKQAEQGNFDRDKWALITRDPRYPEFDRVYATIDFWEFLKLLRKDKEPKIKQPDRQVAWQLKTLISSAKTVLKELEK